ELWRAGCEGGVRAVSLALTATLGRCMHASRAEAAHRLSCGPGDRESPAYREELPGPSRRRAPRPAELGLRRGGVPRRNVPFHLRHGDVPGLQALARRARQAAADDRRACGTPGVSQLRLGPADLRYELHSG